MQFSPYFDRSKVKLPIGIENFEDMRTGGWYYVDKTGLIEQLMERRGFANLFTRPRRFGKSLTMSMLRHFFEPGHDPALFDGLAVSTNKELCEQYQGKHPVISISLKGADGPAFVNAQKSIARQVSSEATRHAYIKQEGRLDEDEMEDFLKVARLRFQDGPVTPSFCDILEESLKILARVLHKHHGQKVILLIDEYDVPLDKAAANGYYDEMVSLIRGMFHAALKTNDDVLFSVMTGCLRVSKESIFTGLNNVRVFSIVDSDMDEGFGFTDAEVRRMLAYYDRDEAFETVKTWYDGYRFGATDVYCPWDVISHVDALRVDPQARPRNWWANTSGNDLIIRLARRADAKTRADLATLVDGGSVEKRINLELTYRDLESSIDNVWSVLYMTGYLTGEQTPAGTFSLRVPNREVQSIFADQIMAWFEEDVRRDAHELDAFCDAVQTGDAAEIERRFGGYLRRVISIRDTAVSRPSKENFYHGLLLGLLSHRSTWSILSNREAGEGYADILIEVPGPAPEYIPTGIVIEVKYATDGAFDTALAQGAQQIATRCYDAYFEDDEAEVTVRLVVACFKKRCRVLAVPATTANPGEQAVPPLPHDAESQQ